MLLNTISSPQPTSAERVRIARVLALELLVVVGSCAFFLFVGLGSFGLVGPDEPRYAQVAREMFERNDLVTPTLYGEVWLEKPALYYWRVMAAYHTFGVSDWVARLPSATFALMMILVIFVHMRRFRPGAQLDSALITASCVAIIGFGRGASTDMQLAAPFAVALLGWYAWYETGKKIWLIDYFFFIGVATLAKGPVAVFLSGAVILLFIGLRRDWGSLKRTFWVPGIGVFLAVVLPWYIAVQMWNPQFFRVFILEHNLARFSKDVYSHTQPFWYYIPIFLISIAPWTFFGIAGIWDALKHLVRQWRLPRREQETQAEAFPEFLLIWLAVPVLFFSISQAKLPGYILPAVPPATILIADYLHRRRREGRDRPRLSLIIAHALLVATVVSLVLLLPHLMLYPGQIPPSGALTVAIGTALLFAAAIFATLRFTGLRHLRVVTLFPLVISMVFLMKVGMPIADAVYSARPVAHLIDSFGVKGPVAGYNIHRATEYGLAYYRDEPVKRYENHQIPPSDHLLITRRTTAAAILQSLAGRRVTKIGTYDPQKLDFYWVSQPGQAHVH